jgi:hypothetical protein
MRITEIQRQDSHRRVIDLHRKRVGFRLDFDPAHRNWLICNSSANGHWFRHLRPVTQGYAFQKSRKNPTDEKKSGITRVEMRLRIAACELRKRSFAQIREFCQAALRTQGSLVRTQYRPPTLSQLRACFTFTAPLACTERAPSIQSCPQCITTTPPRERGRRGVIASARATPTHVTRDRNPRGDGWVARLWWTDGVGQAVPSHLRLRGT